MATRQPRARKRTWKLETLDRNRTYQLWFSEEARRWEIAPALTVLESVAAVCETPGCVGTCGLWHGI